MNIHEQGVNNKKSERDCTPERCDFKLFIVMPTLSLLHLCY